MIARVNVTTIGFASPLRTIVSVICVSGLPRMRLTASLSVMPLTEVSSSLTIRSPDLMPARECRRVVDRRDDFDESVFHADFDAEAAELALRADLQFAKRVLVEICRVRIEAGEHAGDRFGNEFFVFDRLDVVALDATENFGECAQLFDGQRSQHVALGDRREIKRDHDAQAHAQRDQTKLLNLLRIPNSCENLAR